MPWLCEDRIRLGRFRDGERATLTEVYRVYAPGLVKQLRARWRFESGGQTMLFRGCETPFDLDDLLQETFVRAFADVARANYDGLRPFSAYLLGIAQRVVMDSFRKGGRRRRLFEAVDEAPAEEASGATPEACAIEGQLRAVYEGFVATQSPADQTLIRLRFERDAPRREVEAATGYSAMQVRTRESKLRASLLQTLGRDTASLGAKGTSL